MAFDFSFSGGGSSFSYSNRPFFDFFYLGGWEEIIMLLVVFVIGFVVSYTGLKRFFLELRPGGRYWDKARNAWVDKGPKNIVHNRNALIIISLGVALLMTIGLMRNGWLFYYFGNIAGLVLSIIVLMMLIVLIAPFYKAVEKNIGSLLTGILMGPGIWFLLKVITPHLEFIKDTSYLDIWNTWVIGPPGFVILTVFFLVIGLVRKKKNH
jgi:hypothetical protein